MTSDAGGPQIAIEEELQQKDLKFFNLRAKNAEELQWQGEPVSLPTVEDTSTVLGPDAKTLGTLTEPREFNLMFKTIIRASCWVAKKTAAFLRPETAQGIFVNFKNVMRQHPRGALPSASPRSARASAMKSRPGTSPSAPASEFEQMEIEFFCRPERIAGLVLSTGATAASNGISILGFAGERLRLRDHAQDELSHYSVGTADIEYAFPFLAQGDFGELEGVAHRGDFDLRSHMEGKLVHEEPEERQAVAHRGKRCRRQAAPSRQRQGPPLL